MRGVQDLYSPWCGVAGSYHLTDEAAHIELALAAELPMADRFLVQRHSRRRLQVPIVDLDARDMALRSGNPLVRNAQLDHVPQIDADAAVRLVRALDERERVLEAVDHRERHQLEDDTGAVICRLAAELCELLDELRHGDRRVEEVAHLDVAGAQLPGGLEQPLPQLVGRGPALAGRQEPVGEELEFEVADTVV